MVPPSSLDYAGDISAAEAWEQLKADPKAQLIDVRTVAEWNFVGLPDLSSLGRRAHCVEWQSFPTGAQNPGFRAGSGAEPSAAPARTNQPRCCSCAVLGRGRAPPPWR